MFHSKFLVNRQMITDSSQIFTALSKYLTEGGKQFSDFFFRFEWYRIGISIQMDVYSKNMPIFQLRPECQLTETCYLEDLPENIKSVDFKIFVIPYKSISKNEDLNLDILKNWFQKKLKKSAKITKIELGANNRIYYKTNPEDKTYKQIQSYSLNGKLEVIDSNLLNEIRKSPIGYYDYLGCGLLELNY